MLPRGPRPPIRPGGGAGRERARPPLPSPARTAAPSGRAGRGPRAGAAHARRGAPESGPGPTSGPGAGLRTREAPAAGGAGLGFRCCDPPRGASAWLGAQIPVRLSPWRLRGCRESLGMPLSEPEPRTLVTEPRAGSQLACALPGPAGAPRNAGQANAGARVDAGTQVRARMVFSGGQHLCAEMPGHGRFLYALHQTILGSCGGQRRPGAAPWGWQAAGHMLHPLDREALRTPTLGGRLEAIRGSPVRA